MVKKTRTIEKLLKKWFSKNPDVTPEVKKGIEDLIKTLVVEEDVVFNLSKTTFKPVFTGLRKIAENNHPLKQSLICIAFQENASEDLLQQLYDKGFASKTCPTHCSVWCCTAQIEDKDTRLEVVQILMGYHVDHIRYSRDTICSAIRTFNNVHQIKLLLEVGVKLNSCEHHDNGLLCATDSLVKCKLRADVIKLILDQRCPQFVKQLSGDGFTPLQLALERCFDYEAQAIFLLLEQPHVNVNDVANPKGGNLLHFAVNNPYCKLSVVKRLIKMRASVDTANKNGDTPLHLAVKKQASQPNIIKFLIDVGSPINAVNKQNKTALELAVIRGRYYYMLKMLLIEGAHTCVSNDESKHAMLKLALRLYDNDKGGPFSYLLLDVFKSLVKFQFLSEKDFDIEPVIKARKDFLTLYTYAESCADELCAMESENIGYRLCLREFVQDDSLAEKVDPLKPKIIALNRIMKLRPDVKFPLYFDVIATKVFKHMSRSQLDGTLHNLLYVVKDSPEDPQKEVKVSLYHHCVYAISKYLSDAEVLKMIIAFYQPGCDGSSCAYMRTGCSTYKRTGYCAYKRKGCLELPLDFAKKQKMTMYDNVE